MRPVRTAHTVSHHVMYCTRARVQTTLDRNGRAFNACVCCTRFHTCCVWPRAVARKSWRNFAAMCIVAVIEKERGIRPATSSSASVRAHTTGATTRDRVFERRANSFRAVKTDFLIHANVIRVRTVIHARKVFVRRSKHGPGNVFTGRVQEVQTSVQPPPPPPANFLVGNALSTVY